MKQNDQNWLTFVYNDPNFQKRLLKSDEWIWEEMAIIEFNPRVEMKEPKNILGKMNSEDDKRQTRTEESGENAKYHRRDKRYKKIPLRN